MYVQSTSNELKWSDEDSRGGAGITRAVLANNQNRFRSRRFAPKLLERIYNIMFVLYTCTRHYLLVPETSLSVSGGAAHTLTHSCTLIHTHTYTHANAHCTYTQTIIIINEKSLPPSTRPPRHSKG